MANSIIHLRGNGRELEVKETMAEIDALLNGLTATITVTQVKEVTLSHSPTPVDTVAPKEVTEIPHLLLKANIVHVVAAPQV